MLTGKKIPALTGILSLAEEILRADYISQWRLLARIRLFSAIVTLADSKLAKTVCNLAEKPRVEMR